MPHKLDRSGTPEARNPRYPRLIDRPTASEGLCCRKIPSSIKLLASVPVSSGFSKRLPTSKSLSRRQPSHCTELGRSRFTPPDRCSRCTLGADEETIPLAPEGGPLHARQGSLRTQGVHAHSVPKYAALDAGVNLLESRAGPFLRPGWKQSRSSAFRGARRSGAAARNSCPQHLVGGPLDVKFFHSGPERARMKGEYLCCPLWSVDDSPRAIKDSKNMLLFDGFQRTLDT